MLHGQACFQAYPQWDEVQIQHAPLPQIEEELQALLQLLPLQHAQEMQSTQHEHGSG
jgi:hypothetical protein